ncbi:MAG: hypothetical protein ABF630_09415 [Liquorilactobacillus sp.]
MTNDVEWKRISEFPRYLVNRDGEVYSEYKHGLLKQMKDAYGYSQVNLNRHTKKVHRLVAEAFLPNPDNLPQINHKDENKNHNQVNNLEWCSSEYNINYGDVKKRSVFSQKSHDAWKIYQFDLKGNLIKIWSSAREADRNGFNRRSVYRCCDGKIKSFKGSLWSKEKKVMSCQTSN